MSERIGQTWRYHATKKPKLVDINEETLAQMHADGWRDTPAAFKDNEPENEGDGETSAPGLTEVQQALLEVFKDDPEALDKDELMELGKGVGAKLMKAWREPTLVAKIQERLTHGDDQAAN